MRRSPVPVVVIVLAVALMGLLAYALLAGGSGNSTLDTDVKAGAKPAAPAADLRLQNLGGPGTMSLAELRGKVAVVNVWASWCGPCEDEAPLLSAAHLALTKAGAGQVLGVTHQDTTAESRAFERDHAIAFPSVRDPEDALYDAFGGTGVPETYVLDAQGRIVAMARRQIDQDFINNALKVAGTDVQVSDAALARAVDTAERAQERRTATGSGA